MRRLFFAALAVIALTGVSYAANSSISVRTEDGDSNLERSASSTDASRKDDAIKDASEISLDDVSIVSINAGQVVVSNDDDQETAELRGSALESRAVMDYGYFIDVDSSLGSRMFVPSDYINDSFCLDSSDNLMGTRNSTFTCYIGQYSIRFPAYSSPQYRLTSGSSYTWQDTDIEYVSSPNVSILGARTNFWDSRFQTLLLVLIGGLMVCLYLKR